MVKKHATEKIAIRVNIRDFGAIGDGVALDSPAINAAIAAATADGYGEVIIPPGIYRCGSIDLVDNLTLQLEAGAVIRGSRDINDYHEDRYAFNGKAAEGQFLRHYLLGAFNRRNVIITGDGVIDGSGDAFWDPNNICTDGKPLEAAKSSCVAYYRVLKPVNPRPVVVYFWRCQNVTVRQVRIINSPSYTVWPVGCDGVCLDNLTIRNPRHGPNTDALDIDCSSNVIISNCDIDAGDDCIALKSDTSRLGEDKPCERVVVTNCILSASACAIRLGYEGDGIIRDCAFSNLAIHNAKNAIDMLSLTPVKRSDFKRGTPIESIAFSNIVMRNVARPFFIWAGTESGSPNPYQAHVRGLTFSAMEIHTISGSFIGSLDGAAITDVTLRDIRLHLQDHVYFQDVVPVEYPNIWASGFMPDALRLHRVDNAVLDQVAIRITPLPGRSAPYGHCLRWSQVNNFSRDGAQLPANGTML
ncbi:MAG: glycoside hydrolase family 28 protein [Lentisphaeria bacterium]